MKNQKKNMQKGITLIALVVTIVVLIILATVSILAVFGNNGIIARAEKAKELHEAGKADETNILDDNADYIGNYLGENGETTKPSAGVNVIVGGQTVTLTKSNIANYLGKVVTNYVPTTGSVTIDGKSYTVSTNYRLYYVDFDGKYGETNGVYLKADCTSNGVPLGQDTTESTASNIKIRDLNPSLYKTGVIAPSASNSNMKAVTWLLNTSNWDSLKTGSGLANKVNYVVGAPSVEMMFDSYNTKYNLNDKEINIGALTADTERAKLVYQYTNGDSGYKVGPCSDNGTEYDYYTSDYSVKTDPAINSMYYPGSNQYYCLASPSVNDTSSVIGVSYYSGGFVNNNSYDYQKFVLCPLVSIQSSAFLQLQ